MSPTQASPIEIGSFHHVALRCRDAQETVEFYTNVLGMKFRVATRENLYRGKPLNFLHVFLQMKDGNFLSFFELPGFRPQGDDPNTPHWVMHFAMSVDTPAEVDEVKARLLARGVAVDGPVVRPPFHSIYFDDPSGNRMEVTAVGPLTEGRYKLDEAAARTALREWVADRERGVLDNVV